MASPEELYERAIVLGKIEKCAARRRKRKKTTESYMTWLSTRKRHTAAWADYWSARGEADRARQAFADQLIDDQTAGEAAAAVPAIVTALGLNDEEASQLTEVIWEFAASVILYKRANPDD